MTRTTVARAGVAGSASALALVVAHTGFAAAAGGGVFVATLLAAAALLAALANAGLVAWWLYRGEADRRPPPTRWSAERWAAVLVVGQLAGHLCLTTAAIPAHDGGGALALHLCAALVVAMLLAAIDATLAAADRAGAARRQAAPKRVETFHARLLPALVAAPVAAANRVRGPPVAG